MSKATITITELDDGLISIETVFDPPMSSDPFDAFPTHMAAMIALHALSKYEEKHGGQSPEVEMEA